MAIELFTTQSNDSELNLYDVSDMDEDIYTPENISQNIDIEKNEIEDYFVKESLVHFKVYT